MTLTNEVRVENYKARYVDGHMQINLQFNFIEICRKKVLFESHFSRNANINFKSTFLSNVLV